MTHPRVRQKRKTPSLNIDHERKTLLDGRALQAAVLRRRVEAQADDDPIGVAVATLDEFVLVVLKPRKE